MFQEDPTVRRLQERTAEVTGKEAALFVPSGHMGNQICLRAHSQPGDALIAHVGAHVLHYETGTPCAISGLQPRTIDTADGTFTPEQVEPLILPRNIHHARNRILEMENTHNRSGGTVWPWERFSAVAEYGHRQGLAVHLDGARLWNASAASGISVADWCSQVDTVSVCFSKGLGAPVGSAIAGSREFVEECRFYRKMFGGAMRQAGIIAAGALHGLENHRERLVEDHANARLIAEYIGQSSALSFVAPQTNILMIDVTANFSASELAAKLAERGVLVFAIGPKRLRAVTNLNVTTDDCRRAGEQFTACAAELAGAGARA
jgi:threonine aldolase